MGKPSGKTCSLVTEEPSNRDATLMKRNASTDYFRKTKLSKKKMPNCSCICHHLSISILKIERSRQTLIKTLAGSCWKLCPVSCWTPCDNYLPFQFKETKTFRQNKYLTKNHCNILPSLVISRQKKIYSIAT